MKYFLVILLFFLSLTYTGYYLYMYDKRVGVNQKQVSGKKAVFQEKGAIVPHMGQFQVPDYLSKAFWEIATIEQLKEKLKDIKDVNEIHPENGKNMLHFLVIYGKDSKMIDTLISSGIDYKLRDSAFKATALHYAVVSREEDSYEWTRRLLEYNYNIDVVGGQTEASPLMWALYNRSSIRVIQLLLEKGANPNFLSKGRHTPLRAATIPNKLKNRSFIDPEVIQLLLNYKADITIKDMKGKTALDYMEENEIFKKTELFKKLFVKFKPSVMKKIPSKTKYSLFFNYEKNCHRVGIT